VATKETMADKLINPGEPTWFDKLFQKGVSKLPSETGLFSNQPRPTNEKLFIQTVGQGRTQPITEADFTADELFSLQEIIKNNLKQQYSSLQHDVLYNQDLLQRTTDEQTKKIATQRLGQAKIKLQSFLANPQGSIGYDAYKNTPENPDISAGSNPYGSLQTTLGRFSFTVDPKTQMINIKDSYKFNTYEKPGQTAEARQGSLIENTGAGNIYPLVRDIAGRILPPSKGVPVMMSLEYNDPFGDTTK
jgi:hypothetical protein